MAETEVWECDDLRKEIFSYLRKTPKLHCIHCYKVLIWDKMNTFQRRCLIKNKKISINSNSSEKIFSYKFIKDSFKNHILSENLNFNGPVYLYHGMADTDVPYNLSIEICKIISGSKNVNLLLDKKAGHRLSEDNQLKTIISIIERVSN